MSNNYWLKTKGKIIIIVVMALFLSIFLSNNLFIGNQPTLQPDLISKVRLALANLVSLPGRLFSNSEKKKEEKIRRNLAKYPTIAPLPTTSPETVQNLIFQPTDTGVSSVIDQNNGQKYVKIEQGTVVEVLEYTLMDGRRITVIKPLTE